MARMHEILGVEPYEDFKVKGQAGEYCLDKNGDPLQTIFDGNRIGGVYGFVITAAINHGIIRRPRYTPEQVEQLIAFRTLGLSGWWLAKDANGCIFAFENKPKRIGDVWDDNGKFSWVIIDAGFLTWEDEPLSIAQALRDAGVEA